MFQTDLALVRDFTLTRRQSMQVRIEGFNILNTAQFGDPVRYLASPLFGQPPSMLNVMLGTGTPASGMAPALQIGGARSFQATLRWRF